MLSIRTKLSAGIGVLFLLLLAVSVVAIVGINLQYSQTRAILQDNYISIRYCSDMLAALNSGIEQAPEAARFEKALAAQESNITEKGEAAATARIRAAYTRLRAQPTDRAVLQEANDAIFETMRINGATIERKNDRAIATSQNSQFWVSLCTAVALLIGVSLLYNLPRAIAEPVRLITEGIREIARKNYRHRIQLHSGDEFGQMADALNNTTEKLYEWENSNLAKILFEKQRIDTVINQLDDAVLGLDASGNILFLNRAAEELFHLRAAEVTSQYAADVALRNDLLRTVMSDEGRGPLKIVVEGKDAFFTVHSKEVLLGDKPLGRVFTLRNITAFKELDLSKTNLLATISHELKTPISSIKMSATLLEDERVGGMNGEQREMVHSIREDAERLLRLTGELLNITQIETGNIQLKLLPTAPESIVHEAVDAVAVAAQQRGITIHQDIPQNLPRIAADAHKTALVLVNLLTNAIRHSPEGGRVELSVQPGDKSVLFSVRDFGAGIEERHLPKIFDRYFKASGEGSGGTGLGLAISKEFVEAQGGRIGVERELEKGSRFWFSMPFA